MRLVRHLASLCGWDLVRLARRRTWRNWPMNARSYPSTMRWSCSSFDRQGAQMDRKRRFSWLMVPLLVAGFLVVGHGDALAATGDLTQLPDPHECVADTAADGCVVARRMDDLRRVTVSPDGKNVYSSTNGGVVIFDRVVTSAPYGRLSQKAGSDGCIQSNSTTEGCAVEPSRILRVSPKRSRSVRTAGMPTSVPGLASSSTTATYRAERRTAP